jgi:hypothetical protein
MSHPALPARNGPWRLLILDRDPTDPKWILALVMAPGDVRPAQLGPGGTVAGWEMVTAWVRGLLGRPYATLTPLTHPDMWRVDENPQEN